MYDKIAQAMNDRGENNGIEILAEDVEEFLREGSSPYITEAEGFAIEKILEEFL